ncbi:MAG: tetratricopeptide repeat protein [Janthinobacterium lividum]
MNPHAALAQALRLHRSGDTPAAIAACRGAVRDGDAVAMRLLGLLLAEAGLFDEARLWAARATARDGSAETLAAEGRVLAAMRDWPAAATVLRQALAVQPGFTAARRLLDRVEAAGAGAQSEAAQLFQSERFAEAAALFRQACLVRPGDPKLLHALGAALHEAGQPGEAVAAYQAALAAAPRQVASWHNLGSALQAVGDLPGAMHAYARAYAADPASFPRIAQELAAGRSGQVWLTAGALRARLHSIARGHGSGPDTLPDPPAPHPQPG